MEVYEKRILSQQFCQPYPAEKISFPSKSVPSLNSEITLSDKEKDVLRFICMDLPPRK